MTKEDFIKCSEKYGFTVKPFGGYYCAQYTTDKHFLDDGSLSHSKISFAVSLYSTVTDLCMGYENRFDGLVIKSCADLITFWSLKDLERHYDSFKEWQNNNKKAVRKYLIEEL